MASSTSIPKAINAAMRLSILILLPISSAAISAIIKEVNIPMPTTKAIRTLRVSKRAIITKISPKRILEETKFRRFLIQIDVSV